MLKINKYLYDDKLFIDIRIKEKREEILWVVLSLLFLVFLFFMSMVYNKIKNEKNNIIRIIISFCFFVFILIAVITLSSELSGKKISELVFTFFVFFLFVRGKRLSIDLFFVFRNNFEKEDTAFKEKIKNMFNLETDDKLKEKDFLRCSKKAIKTNF